VPRPRAVQPKYTLTKRGAVYYVQWWEDGRAHRVSCRTADIAEARRFLAELIAELATPAKPRSPTVGAILDGYEADRSLSEGSPTMGYVVANLKSVLGDLPPELLTRERIRHYAAERRHQHIEREKDKRATGKASPKTPIRPLSNGTIIRELVILRAALRWAITSKWISDEPKIDLPPAPPARTRWLTRQEANRLIASAEAPHIKLFIVLGLYTAARAGALLELRWEQIDMDRGYIALGRGRANKRRSVVPITPELRAALTVAQESRVGDYVVSPNDKRLGSIKTGFNAACRRARLDDVTPHTLRHTAASWMVQGGVSFELVASFLGNSVAMVEKVYGHLHPEHLRGAAAALSGVLRGEKIS
jgi:integrase